MDSSSIELIFVPATGAGHLVSAVEMAKLLVSRDPRLSISVLLLKFPFDSSSNTSAESLSSSAASDRIKFVDLPRDDPPTNSDHMAFLRTFYQSQKPYVRDAVGRVIASGPASPRLAGFLLDMFCTVMIDVADEFGVPSYVFFTSSAGALGLTIHTLPGVESDDIEFGDELVVPGISNPLPRKALPSVLLDKASAPVIHNIGRRIAKAKGVLVNTFEELESSMIDAFSSFNFPPLYPVGPVININPGDSHGAFGGIDRKAEIMEWLDGHPASSVVFLCFGSMGSFGGDQVKEIATALERSGVRFLWSLRRPPQKDEEVFTLTEYENPAEVLPEGFLERMAGVGKVVGWTPQVAVLGHPAVGGFVSHCGWNSTLESVWFGVPLAAWPLYAEQQFNAFELVTEFGLAVDIAMDYRRDFNRSEKSGDSIVTADRIERGIRRLMESEGSSDAIRKRVKEMSEKSKKALFPGGSSYTSLSHFINEVVEFNA